MSKIAVIGGRGTLLVFKALGFEGFAAENSDEVRSILRRLTGVVNEYAIIYIEEKLSAGLESEIDKLKGSLATAVVLIPGRYGKVNPGQAAIEAAADRAAGNNVF